MDQMARADNGINVRILLMAILSAVKHKRTATSIGHICHHHSETNDVLSGNPEQINKNTLRTHEDQMCCQLKHVL